MSTAKKTQTNPFMDFDFTKFTADFKVPGLDVTEIVDYQKKNFEAMTAANKVAFEAVQAVAQRQAELVKAAIDELSAAAKSVGEVSAEHPVDVAVKGTDSFKKSLADAQANLKELLEMVQKSQDEAGSILNTRFNEALDEVKTAMAKLGK